MAENPPPAAPEGPSPELDRAIRDASVHLGERVPAAPHPSRLGGTERREAWRFVLPLLLLLLVVGGLSWIRSSTPTLEPDRLEADLRWAVEEVVQEIERQRAVRGRIPERHEIQMLLSEAVVYTPEGEVYRVVGERDGVRVEFDAIEDLDEWRLMRSEADGPEGS